MDDRSMSGVSMPAVIDRAAAPAFIDNGHESAADVLDSLVLAAREGDVPAFEALVTLRMRSAYRLARAILGSTEEAEDATQEAFVAAWRGLHSLRDSRRFDAWFQRILVNACRMSIRQRPRAIMVTVESLGENDGGAQDQSVIDLPGADALQRAIDSLTVPQRTILALRHFEDRSVAEIGAMMEIPIGTAKWRLHDARAALERALQAQQ
jgi:RNA polymerase sigma-70 factor, ECF subfamily